jgi:iron complex transport system substrate-binding protein
MVLVAALPARAAVLTDQTGKAIPLPDNPKRVVSLAPNITEMVFALGAEDLLVGRSQFSDYPPEALRLPSVGSYYRPDIERVVALRPDLCLAARDGPPVATLERLEQLGIPVFILDPQSLQGVRETLLLLGEALGRRQEAARLAETMDGRLRALDARVEEALRRTGKRPAVFLQLQAAPLMGCGRGTYPGELIFRAGGDNPLRSNTPYPRLSMEDLLALRPDVIIAPEDKGPDAGDANGHGSGSGTALAAYQSPPFSRSIPAARSGRVHVLPADLLFRPSPRGLDALESLIPLLFPGGEPPEHRAETRRTGP